jgi:ferredoxin
MDFFSIVEGPLLWIVSLVFLTGLFIRLSFFVRAIITSSSRIESKGNAYIVATLGRLFLPLHKTFTKKPFYTTLRYVFHVCLLAVPIWLSGHIVLWSESRFEWDWMALPDAWADWMTLTLLALAAYFLFRRLILKNLRQGSSILDILLIIITALPFLTGYFLTHGTLESITFVGNNMVIFHMLSAQLMILTAIFLFYKSRLNKHTCTGCAACVQNCPTETLEANDKENLRIFSYAHFKCICCGSCVGVCPEGAAELRHEINPKRFLKVFSKREIRSVELEACERCGAYFAPESQIGKIGKGLSFDGDYLKCCPNCRKTNMGERLHQMSPWHRRQKKSDETLKTARH